jgi:hypothetical protein
MFIGFLQFTRPRANVSPYARSNHVLTFTREAAAVVSHEHFTVTWHQRGPWGRMISGADRFIRASTIFWSDGPIWTHACEHLEMSVYQVPHYAQWWIAAFDGNFGLTLAAYYPHRACTIQGSGGGRDSDTRMLITEYTIERLRALLRGHQGGARVQNNFERCRFAFDVFVRIQGRPGCTTNAIFVSLYMSAMVSCHGSEELFFIVGDWELESCVVNAPVYLQAPLCPRQPNPGCGQTWDVNVAAHNNEHLKEISSADAHFPDMLRLRGKGIDTLPDELVAVVYKAVLIADESAAYLGNNVEFDAHALAATCKSLKRLRPPILMGTFRIYGEGSHTMRFYHEWSGHRWMWMLWTQSVGRSLSFNSVVVRASSIIEYTPENGYMRAYHCYPVHDDPSGSFQVTRYETWWAAIFGGACGLKLAAYYPHRTCLIGGLSDPDGGAMFISAESFDTLLLVLRDREDGNTQNIDRRVCFTFYMRMLTAAKVKDTCWLHLSASAIVKAYDWGDGSDEDRREFFEPREWVLESCRVVAPTYQQLGMSLLQPWDVDVAAHAPDETPASFSAPPLVIPCLAHIFHSE